MKLLLATHNQKKRKELGSIMKGTKDIKIMILDDLKVEPPIIVEDGKTFRQNAVKKALTLSRFFDDLVLADDSGLEVDAIEGKPGVRSARFARAKATDQENNVKLLKLLSNVPENDRTARFVCNLALARKGQLLENFEGSVEGKIVFLPKGKNGFGYDPLFQPKGSKKTFAEMPASEKNKISHRGRALEQLKKSIDKYLC